MVQRILERGQIETLASRAIPRVRLPPRELFARRAARLRQLAEAHAIGDYLRLMARVADVQHAVVAEGLDLPLPSQTVITQAAAHRMPPLAAASWPRMPAWRAVLRRIVEAVDAAAGAPAAVGALLARLRAAPDEWIEAQAAAVLGGTATPVDAAAAPFVMAALQVCGVALTAAFTAERVAPLDVPGVCPLCGSLPVASIVHAQAPNAGYRYLHCALCATEWHRVRAQCSQCGNGKHIGYYYIPDQSGTDHGGLAQDEVAAEVAAVAVRAEACDECHTYRKIVYVEHDPAVEPVADDLASLTLDLLLGERGYHRTTGNPLLWQTSGD